MKFPVGLFALKRLLLSQRALRTVRAVNKISRTVVLGFAMRVDWNFTPSLASAAAEIQIGLPAFKTWAFLIPSFIVPDVASALTQIFTDMSSIPTERRRLNHSAGSNAEFGASVWL